MANMWSIAPILSGNADACERATLPLERRCVRFRAFPDPAVRFRPWRAVGAGGIAQALAASAGDLRRRSRGPALRRKDRSPGGGAGGGSARADERTLSPAADLHRLQHRQHHRARHGARGAGGADCRHRPGDQTCRRADAERDHGPARHSGDDPAEIRRRSRSAIRCRQAPAPLRCARTGRCGGAEIARRCARSGDLCPCRRRIA